MCKMEYLYLANRLNAIRLEIKELREQPVTSISEKIKILKEKNILLREQNRLLLKRQAILNKKQELKMSY